MGQPANTRHHLKSMTPCPHICFYELPIKPDQSIEIYAITWTEMPGHFPRKAIMRYAFHTWISAKKHIWRNSLGNSPYASKLGLKSGNKYIPFEYAPVYFTLDSGIHLAQSVVMCKRVLQLLMTERYIPSIIQLNAFNENRWRHSGNYKCSFLQKCVQRKFAGIFIHSFFYEMSGIAINYIVSQPRQKVDINLMS